MSTEIRAPRIDAHHHVWDLAVRDQPWTVELPPLRRTFTFAELAAHLGPAQIDGTVLVETINLAPETGELLALADADPRIRGVVGWVDLTADDVAERLARLRELPGGRGLVGIRHQVQGEPDPEWLLRPEVLRGLHAVAEAGLAFDLLVVPEQLPAAVQAVRRVPEGRFVLAHLGKPPIATGALQPWADQAGNLAAYDNVAAKLSGLVTEATASWTVADLEPYAEHALDAFGADRIMAGSDWPVCLLRADYQQVWEANRQLISGLSADEQAAVLGGTATTWYGLS